MKKTLAIMFAALTMGLSANAIKAVHNLFPVKQSDGTSVMLYKNGNGYLAFYTTPDNKVVVGDGDGMLCYAELRDGKLVASSVRVHDVEFRTASEQDYVSSIKLTPAEAMESELSGSLHKVNGVIQKSIGTSTTDGLGKYGESAKGSLPSIGSPLIPVIMVEFSDCAFQPSMTTEKYSRFMNEEGYNEDSEYERGSVKDYFKSQSRGMFNPTFDVVAKVTLSRNRAYYGANQNGQQGRDTRVLPMVQEAIAGAVAQGVSFDKYLVDGRIPNVILLYAGYGEATGGDADCIWPHEMDIPSYYGNFSGYRFSSYFVGNELNGSNGTTVMGMGVMVHELGHALGLPDLYDPTYSHNSVSAYGYWSVMESGPYIDDAYAPIGYTAYERSYLGWLKLRELSDAESIVLSNPNNNEGEYAVMLRNPQQSNEYFIMENRQPGTWYPTSFGSGLLVSRIAFNASTWSSNRVNTDVNNMRAMVQTASGKAISGSASPSDMYGNGVNNIETFKLISGSNLSDVPVYKILKGQDGTITLNFKDKTLPTPVPATEEQEFEKVTDAATIADGDDVILVVEQDGVALSKDVQGLDRGARTIELADGKAKICNTIEVFKIAKTSTANMWAFMNSDGTYLCSSSTGLISVSKIGKNSTAKISITDGNASIVFQGTAQRKNLIYNESNYNFMGSTEKASNIQIYRKVSGSSAIDAINVNRASCTDGKLYNLSGQQVGDGYKGIVIVNGKKVNRK